MQWRQCVHPERLVKKPRLVSGRSVLFIDFELASTRPVDTGLSKKRTASRLPVCLLSYFALILDLLLFASTIAH